MPILTRYVLLELTKVFLMTSIGITSLMMTVGVVKEATYQGLPMAQAIWLIPYLMPESLRFALPVTLLLSTTTVYSRMSGSNEVVAIKALGISPMAILQPAFVMAFLLSLTTFWIGDLAVTWGREGVERVVAESVEEIVYSVLRTQRTYTAPGSRFAIQVRRVDGHKLIGTKVSVKGRGLAPATVITAEEAELRCLPEQNVVRLSLRNGCAELMGNTRFDFHNDFQEYEIPLREGNKQEPMPSEMPYHLLSDGIDQQTLEVRRAQQETAARMALTVLAGDADFLAHPLWNAFANNLQDKQNHLHRLRTEPYRRWAAGFSCLFFVWVGAPLAIRLRNGDLLTSFFLCFLPILIIYYPLLIYGVNAAKHGTAPPYAVWAGNLMLFAAGSYLLRKVIRY